MIKKFAIVVFASVVLAGCFSYVRAAGRKPPAQPAATQTPQAAPPPDPLFQCQYCKRSFKGSEGKMMRFHAHDKDNWICVDCFFDSIDFAQKYKTRVESIEAARNKKK